MKKKNEPMLTPVHILSRLAPSEAILVGFSGGADSRVLLHLLAGYCRENGATLYAAHIDHGIRGEEARRDREFCVRTADEYGIKIFVLEADVPALAREHHESLETEARRVRYDYFADIMAKNNIRVLATAHNADDNLETMLFNLTRGSGLRGIAGIPASRPFGEGGVLVRPLLGVPKSEILAYCEENKLGYVTDSTNSDEKYSRNLIRHKVIPLLEQINGGLLSNSARLAAAARAADEFISAEAEGYIKERGEDANRLDSLCRLPDAVRLTVLGMLYSAAADGRIAEETHLASLDGLCRRGVGHSALSLPGLVRAQIEGGRLVFVHDPRLEFRHL